MSYGGDYIYTILSTDPDVTAITTAIYNARLIPQTEDSTETINFYRSAPFNAALNYFDAVWSIDCRAKSEYEAYDLADKVKDALNRKSATVGSYIYFGTISILPAIPPADDADVYNVPVEISLRRK